MIELQVFILFAVIVAIVYYASRDKRPRVPPAMDGPGTFRVHGVDRETQEDVEKVFPAASSANAKAKAELEGMVVTGVERE